MQWQVRRRLAADDVVDEGVRGRDALVLRQADEEAEASIQRPSALGFVAADRRRRCKHAYRVDVGDGGEHPEGARSRTDFRDIVAMGKHDTADLREADVAETRMTRLNERIEALRRQVRQPGACPDRSMPRPTVRSR